MNMLQVRRHRCGQAAGRAVGARWLALALGGLLAGCGGEDQVPLYPAGGVVIVDGKPAEGVQVVLYPADQVGNPDTLRPRGTTGADGSFALGTYEPGDGAPSGPYVVTLFWPDRPPGPSPPDDRLGGRHANPTTSGLEVAVSDEATRFEPFRITRPPAMAKARRAGPPARPDFDGMIAPSP